MPNTAVYCPGLNSEMQGDLDSMVYYKWVDKADVHVGGGLSLGRVDPQWKLYHLCHGHAQLPLFSTKAGKWSAKELATLMCNDGFKNTHRSVELLVCHAGQIHHVGKGRRAAHGDLPSVQGREDRRQ